MSQLSHNLRQFKLREGEIAVESNVQNLHIPNSDKPVKFYDLDVVISVGYRVKSIHGTLSAPQEPPCRRIGFGIGEDDKPAKPHGKLS